MSETDCGRDLSPQLPGCRFPTLVLAAFQLCPPSVNGSRWSVTFAPSEYTSNLPAFPPSSWTELEVARRQLEGIAHPILGGAGRARQQVTLGQERAEASERRSAGPSAPKPRRRSRACCWQNCTWRRANGRVDGGARPTARRHQRKQSRGAGIEDGLLIYDK